MRRYMQIKKEFEFLARLYGFKICFKQKHGAYYFIEWTNLNVNIMILYDERIKDPVTIRIYDANSLGTFFDAKEYNSEFAQEAGTPLKKIRSAAEWLKNAIAHGVVCVGR